MYFAEKTPCILDRVLHRVFSQKYTVYFGPCITPCILCISREHWIRLVIWLCILLWFTLFMRYFEGFHNSYNTIWWGVYLITTPNTCRFRRKLDHLAFRSAQDCSGIAKNRDKNRSWTKSPVLHFWTSSNETFIQRCEINKTKSTVS